jgi:hypothetical protein
MILFIREDPKVLNIYVQNDLKITFFVAPLH